MIVESTLAPHADVVVVGGGITGLTAARHLADRGSRVVVLDAGPIPDADARAPAPSLLLAGLSVPYPVLAQALGRESARTLWETTLEERRRILAEAGEASRPRASAFRGHLELATDHHEAEALEDAGRLQQEDGFAARWWSPERIDRELGIPGSHGGLLDPEAAPIDPTALRARLVTTARARGATILGGVSVLGLEENTDGVVVVATHRGRVTAEMALLATNVSLPELHPFLEDKFASLRLLHVVFGLGEAMPRVAVGIRNGTLSWAPLDGLELLAGVTLPHAARDDVAPLDWETELRRHLLPFVPAMHGAVPLRRSSGLEAFPCDGLPVVGRIPGQARWLVAGGYAGRGLVLGHLAGRSLANAMVDSRLSPALEPLAPHRFL